MNGLSYGVIDKVALTFKRVLAYNRKEFIRKGSKKGRQLELLYQSGYGNSILILILL